MQCPECQSTHIRKNGIKRGKQNNICVDCKRQFIEWYEPRKGYSDEVKRECLKMYVNGMGFRAIERVKGVHHTTVITWLKQVEKLPTCKLSWDALLCFKLREPKLLPFPIKFYYFQYG